MHHMINEAIKNSLHLRNFNRDWGFNLSQSWHLVSSMIK